MKLEKNTQYMDNYCWRCRSKNPQHDIKYNIRKNLFFFENIKIPLSLIYYLSFKCFIENMSTNKSLTNSEELCKKLHIPNTTHKSIIKLFRLLRNRIKISFHLQWNRTKLALDPAENGHPSVEIDETALIGNSNSVIWAFGIIDRATKQTRVFCFMNDRRKETLNPIIKKHVNTIPPINGNNEFQTRIYSDCFSSYRENDFNHMHYVLHRVNHSVWFGQGNFHTNTAEGLWGCLKRISNNFTGVNFKLLNELENNGINPKDYIDDWICYCLFKRELEKKN